MINEAYNLPQAFDLLYSARNVFRPNKVFVIELRMLERATYGQNFEVTTGRIGLDDTGKSHELGWEYSLTKLYAGWVDDSSFITVPDWPRPEQGICRLVWNKLGEAMREDISKEEAARHIGDVICAWFHRQDPNRVERGLLFRILWRGLPTTNVMTRDK